MPLQSPEHIQPDTSKREEILKQSQWEIEVGNWRELGEVVATFNVKVGNVMGFTGIASYTEEDGVKKLSIELLYCAEADEANRCVECHKIPSTVTVYNPSLCINCFGMVCDNCIQRHHKGHYKPVKTIGGETIEEAPF